MNKIKVSLEIAVDNKTYQFFCDHDCTLDKVFHALSQMKDHVAGRILEAEQKAQQEKESQCHSQEE